LVFVPAAAAVIHRTTVRANIPRSSNARIRTKMIVNIWP
jgi:hypothetical protein